MRVASALELALEHARRGFRVFPLGHNSKKPLIPKAQGGNGCHDATTDEAQIRAWFFECPRANIGIAAGDDLVFIDEDAYKGADISGWNLPRTLMAYTPSGGYHRYLRYSGLLPCRNENDLAPGVCIKAAGGYVVAPGSVINGKPYAWVDEQQPIANLPERIAEMIRGADAPPPPSYRANGNGHAPSGDIGTYWLARALEKSSDGSGDTTGFWLACQLLIEEKHGASLDVRGVLLDYAQQATLNPRDPFTERDMNRWIASANRSRIVQFGTPARSHRESGASGDSYAGERAKREKSEKTPADDQGDTSQHVPPTGIEALIQRLPSSNDNGESCDAQEEDNEPLALPAEHAVAPFPVAALPKAMRDLTEEGAKAICCPPDFIGVTEIAVAGAAIGNSTCLEIKPGWREFAVIEAAVVADPGSAKSPAYDLGTEPFVDKQKELVNTFKEEMARYAEAESDETTKGKVPEPVLSQVWTNDATLESLGDALEANPRGMLFMREELAGWARAMNQYKGGKGADRQAWLSLWSCAPVMVNRRGRKQPQYIPHPFVGVAGTIQPDILSELSDERGREDGFIHRILFSYPARMSRRWTEDTVAEKTRAAYRAMFDKLWALRADENDDGSHYSRVLKFTEAGKKAWVTWITDHYAEMDAPEFPVTLRGPWAKMQGYAARFALILHLCRNACGESKSLDVDEMSMLAAADLVDYFKSHARAVYRQLRATPEDKQVTDALAWIHRQPGQLTTARNLLTASIGGVSTAAEAKHLLEQLQDRGYGKVEEKPSKHGRPSFIFTLTLQLPASSNNAPAQEGRVA